MDAYRPKIIQATQMRDVSPSAGNVAHAATSAAKPRLRRKKDGSSGPDDSSKRRCVSTACIACRKRKSKCDGNLPACAACSSVYDTECIYDPNSDHRRKGVYKKDPDKLKPRSSTLEVLIHAIQSLPEDEAQDLVTRIRTSDDLDVIAQNVLADESPVEQEVDTVVDGMPIDSTAFESQLADRMGELRLEEGSTRYFGGTSNLLHLDNVLNGTQLGANMVLGNQYQSEDSIVTSWTNVTNDADLVNHLLNMYFTWHYSFFTTLSKSLFFRDFNLGKPPGDEGRKYCTPLLVNAMLALGCHFTAWKRARERPTDSATTGDHFFREAKRLIMENDEHEKPRLTTVQALALMSVREAGCGREAKGWVYSGMSFRLACDLGLNLDLNGPSASSKESNLSDEEIDARRITFWGCFLFDKCWSNYLGRLPQLPSSIANVSKFEIWPNEESEGWAAYTDSGWNQSHAQPARTRAIALQISTLCEISGDLLNDFYNPMDLEKTKAKQFQLKKLSDIHRRLETWRRELPKEMEPKEGGLPSMLVMHMFFQLLYIHLFRPFLKYNQATSPLPPNVSPRRLCTQAAAAISKLLRLYKRSHGLRQIPNIVVYIAHSACTIHLLNLPDKNASRDITHGVKHMEEIAETWLCARRTLAILSMLSKKWKAELPEEAAAVLARTDAKFGAWSGETQVKSPPQRSDPFSASAMARPGAVSQITRATNLNAGNPLPSRYSKSPALSADGEVATAPHRSNQKPTFPSSAFDYQRVLLQQPPSHSPSPRVTAHTVRNSIEPVAAPATTPNARIDALAGPPSNSSPSTLLGNTDHTLRDGQDWWLRDQNQLALGFEQWPVGDIQDPSSWLATTSAPSAPATTSPDVFASLTGAWDGTALGNSGGLGLGNVIYPINHYPNESEWYQ